MTQLSIDKVTVALGHETVVHAVSAELAPGSLYIIVGPNGAGKTTLLKAMASLLPLQSGAIRLDGRDLKYITQARRAEQMAYLPQDRSIAWDLSCVDIAALGAPHLSPEQARRAAFAELQALGLQEVSDRGVFSLSGGQRARVLLARVLAGPAKVLLLDEPLIALDPAWQRQVLIRLKARAESGQTVVLSLHDLHLAAQFADSVLLMKEGRLIKMDQPEKIFVPRLLSDVFNLDGELVDGALRLESRPRL
ncbi:ABC transporter ATP-binding protein [Asticcacaulis sp. 201]|uniref:ABC transporter ATP-binding protein n=1 Tax=Asticcacaulis sp. 201 TaxID=3028787 RepID=UPI002916E082|nr:ABC transporter ATP-binding protein [Asticcacaulis sp. 201]MDV6329242.1 ABC transporter ATP-binding protein [Asticcacaulis sp. 201]